jgi:AcrR family transcriptional regulator
MSLRDDKKRQQRREILEEAIALFRERGYDETRIQDVIDRVRISEATFFNYFPTKDALLEEYALSRIEAYARLLRVEVEDRTRSVAERMRDLLRIIATGLEQEEREFMAVVATRSRLFFGGKGGMFERKVLAQGLLARLFEEGQANGEIRTDTDPELLAESLAGAYTFTMVNWLTCRWEDSGPLRPRLQQVADVFLEGCRATTKAAVAARRRA